MTHTDAALKRHPTLIYWFIMILVIIAALDALDLAIVRTAASNAGLSIAEGLGKSTLYASIVFSVAIALTQLDISEELVTSAFITAFGAISLALALAFGIGGKDVTGEYLRKWLKTE